MMDTRGIVDRRRVIHRAVAAGIVIAWACTTGEQGDPAPGGAFRLEVLDSVAHRAVGPSFAAFAEVAEGLREATAAHAEAAAAGADDLDARRQAAQDAWRAAIDAWQVVEVMQLGPAGSSFAAIGGEDLRDEIYSWPSVNTCRIDQELLLEQYEADDFMQTRLVDSYGLDALEYLLFHDQPDNTCAPQLPINEPGQWDALTEEQLATRRATYGAAVAAGVAAVAGQLAEAWAPDGGAYTEWLAEPGQGGSPYEDPGVALDELLRAMFYVDSTLKDAKIAYPGGILGCGTDTCIEAVESPWAQHSRANVLANLEGFRRLFLGGSSAQEGVGFDDLLVEVGEAELAAAMVGDIDAALAEVEAIDGTFTEALMADGAALDPTHAAIQRITDALKGDFPTALRLTIPSEAAGDAD